ncbi:unnamed protein product [Sphagnum balticum]
MRNPFIFSLDPSPNALDAPYYRANFHQNNIDGQKTGLQVSRAIQGGRPNRGELVEDINLNDNVSFARNFKTRLYNIDPKEEEAKENVARKYR